MQGHSFPIKVKKNTISLCLIPNLRGSLTTEQGADIGKQRAPNTYTVINSNLLDFKADPRQPQIVPCTYTSLKWGNEDQGKF